MREIQPAGKDSYTAYALYDPDGAKGEKYKRISPSRALEEREKGTPFVDVDRNPRPVVYKVPDGRGKKHKVVTEGHYEDYVYGKTRRHDPLVFKTTEVKKVAAAHGVPAATVKGIIRDMDRVAMVEIGEYGRGGRRAEAPFSTIYRKREYEENPLEIEAKKRYKSSKKYPAKTAAERQRNREAAAILSEIRY